jgi:Bacterial archaeo-eukaryotic release factor family 10
LGPRSELAREELNQLAEFWSNQNDALSVYFQPSAPSELAHREEPIVAKEKIQQKLRSLAGNSPADRGDIRRVIETIGEMRGNHRKSKVIFACASQKFWREYDLPGDFGVRLEVGNSFMLAPLVTQQQMRRRYSIALADRHQARLLLLEAREIIEQDPVLEAEEGLEKLRTTGARKSVYIERKKEERVRRHYAYLMDKLLHFHEHGDFDALIIGCRSEMWPEIEAELHPDLARVLAGRFTCDPGQATQQEIAEKAQALIDERLRREEEALLDRVAGAAASDGLGAMGYETVLDALEKHEVRALLFPADHTDREKPISLCSNCGHLQTGEQEECGLCASGMRGFAHPEEALLRHALGNSMNARSTKAPSIEMRMLTWTRFPPEQPLAAWLRFRAHRSTPLALAG